MIPWELLDAAPVPGSTESLSLYRRGDEFAIRVGNRELMNSRMHASEDALADLTCTKLGVRNAMRVLIGGLGMGFTLAALLRRITPTSTVVVAELVPQVVLWNHGPLGLLANHPLKDRRVVVREEDVMHTIQCDSDAYDAILLDVDNGPEDLLLRGNDRLYTPPLLTAARNALRPRGVLGIWSAASDAAFVRRLHSAGLTVEAKTVRARGPHGGGRHTIWLAQRSAQSRRGPTDGRGAPAGTRARH